ncbi:MAG: L-threonylcarbamoyladenylate synthase [Coriobacteriia bacterium]|nr:L-threonylcarbamoyladenylate synthase [Coriobacteriia bacterium]
MSTILRVNQDDPSAEVLNAAAAELRRGSIVLFPTDTVYGLGACANIPNCYGAQELFDIKQRPPGVPVPLLVGKPNDLYVYGKDFPDYAIKLAEKFWPGSLTIVVKASDRVLPEFRNAEDDTVGLRCPDSQLMRELAISAGGPIFATSANTHGHPAPESFDEVEDRILAHVKLALDGGKTKVGASSTVVICTGDTPVVVRETTVTQAEIDAVLAED